MNLKVEFFWKLNLKGVTSSAILWMVPRQGGWDNGRGCGMDNGVMVAWTGLERLRLGLYEPPPPPTQDLGVVDVRPRWPLGHQVPSARAAKRRRWREPSSSHCCNAFVLPSHWAGCVQVTHPELARQWGVQLFKAFPQPHVSRTPQAYTTNMQTHALTHRHAPGGKSQNLRFFVFLCLCFPRFFSPVISRCFFFAGNILRLAKSHILAWLSPATKFFVIFFLDNLANKLHNFGTRISPKFNQNTLNYCSVMNFFPGGGEIFSKSSPAYKCTSRGSSWRSLHATWEFFFAFICDLFCIVISRVHIASPLHTHLPMQLDV